MKKILITGASGFIGSHVAASFKNHSFPVVLVSRSKRHGIDYVFDLRDTNLLKKCLQKEKPDVLCHHGSPALFPHESRLHPESVIEDIKTTTTLFELAVQNNVRQIIFASSSSVYSPDAKQPVAEVSTINPLAPSSISKYAIELYCQYLQHYMKIQTVVFRYFNVYGPGQKIHKHAAIIPGIITNALQNKPVIIFGDGNQTRDFVYVTDVAEANYLAVQKNAEGIFNVGTGKPVSINSLLKLAEQKLDRPVRVFYKPAQSKTTHSYADISKIRISLGWKAKIDIVRGFSQTIDYYRCE